MMLEISDLAKSFGPRVALAGVNLIVEEGEFVILLGPNGAGKTTLLRTVATLTRPTSGMVRIAGSDPLKVGLTVRQQIGYLSHRTLLYNDLSAEQNLLFYARMYGLADPDARIAELLERVDLADRRDDLVRNYSRGMQQRLAVVRTMLHRPRLLLLDEPYTGLDPLAADRLTELLTELSEEGCTLLLATHHMGDLAAVNKRAVILSRGRVIHDDVIADVAGFPALYRDLVLRHTSDGGATTRAEPPRPLPVAASGPSRPRGADSLPGFLRQVLAVVAKDLTAELRTREILSAMFVFAFLAMLIFSFALDLRGAVARAAAPGVLWTTIAFAGTLGLSRSMAREQETGGMDGLRLSPADRTVILFGKALGNMTMMLALEAVLVPLSAILFNVPLFAPGVLAILLGGTLGYALVGTLLAAIAVNTRAREVMLPILLLPLVMPLLIAAVQATRGLLEGLTWTELGGWINLLVVYDLLIAAAALLTFEYVVES